MSFQEDQNMKSSHEKFEVNKTDNLSSKDESIKKGDAHDNSFSEAEDIKFQQPSMLVKWLVSGHRKTNDNYYELNGCRAGRTLVYENFVQEKEKISFRRGRSKRRPLICEVKTYYKPASYACRKVKSWRPGSLKLLYNYYSKLLTPEQKFVGRGVQKGLLYEDIRQANTTMSLPELVSFANTFGIVPKLLSQAALHFAWQRQKHSQEYSKPSISEANHIDFQNFIEILVRCALLAFPLVESPRKRVESLAKYLDLGNSKKYRHTLKVMSRIVQADIYPTDDIDKGKYVKTSRNFINQNESKSPKSAEKKRIKEIKKIAKSRMTSTELQRVVEADTVHHIRSIGNEMQIQYVPNLKPRWKPIQIDPGESQVLLKVDADIADNRKVTRGNLQVYWSRSSENLQREFSPSFCRGKGQEKGQKGMVGYPTTHRMKQKNERADANNPMKVPSDNSPAQLRVAFHREDAVFDPSLCDLLYEYEYEGGNVDWLPFSGEFIDMGNLSLNSSHRYKIELKSRYQRNVKFELCVFGLPEASVNFDPRETALGIVRVAHLEIFCSKPGEHLAWLKVLVIGKNNKIIESEMFPIYCNIKEPPPDDVLEMKNKLSGSQTSGSSSLSPTHRTAHSSGMTPGLSLPDPETEKNEGVTKLPISALPKTEASNSGVNLYTLSENIDIYRSSYKASLEKKSTTTW